MMSPGSGDSPVGQFDAQNLLPNGKGIPSLASSINEVTEHEWLGQMNKITCVLTLIHAGSSERLFTVMSINKNS